MLIPLASDLMYEFHGTERNSHTFLLLDLEKSQISLTKKKEHIYHAGVCYLLRVLQICLLARAKGRKNRTEIEIDTHR